MDLRRFRPQIPLNILNAEEVLFLRQLGLSHCVVSKQSCLHCHCLPFASMCAALSN